MFDKNMESIDNLALKRRLARVSDVESKAGISYCVTPSNDYILLKDDVPSDDLNNPREAVKSSLKETIKSPMSSNDIIINFGIGLGYLLDETFNSYPSKIYVYEPDLNFLHFVLSNVDISEHLSSGRVFITNDLEELSAKISATYLSQDKVEIVYLKNYAVVKNKELLMLTQKVLDSCKSKMVDINTITRFSRIWLTNAVNNIASINNGKQAYLLSELERKFVGQTALIAAAGPSLSDNISRIQSNRDKFVVIAVNKSVKYLLQNGVTPDFVVCLDAGFMEKSFRGIDPNLSGINCIMDIRADKNLLSLSFNKFFLNFSETDFLGKKLAKYNETIKFYEIGGSASTLALVAAVKMGFSKIILAGLDLAFKDNVVYTSGEVMNRISQNEILIDNEKKNIVQVRSVNGGMVYTREDYEAFIHHFNSLIKDLKFQEIYNISSFGALLQGVKNVSFDELELSSVATMSPVSFIPTFNFKMKEFIDEEFFHINTVISLLSKGVFSPALVNAIVKSTLVYQYMQAEVLEVLQKNFAPELAESFVEKTKVAIKTIVELLQKNKLI